MHFERSYTDALANIFGFSVVARLNSVELELLVNRQSSADFSTVVLVQSRWSRRFGLTPQSALVLLVTCRTFKSSCFGMHIIYPASRFGLKTMGRVRHLRNKRKEKAARRKRLATVLHLNADNSADDELLALLTSGLPRWVLRWCTRRAVRLLCAHPEQRDKILGFFSWIFDTDGKDYQYTFETPIKYVHCATNKRLNSKLVVTVATIETG
ncbi:hypothetical protein DFH11DRAFT_1741874 [Phellopilus nigrolimitatus]|nr:hypothetical protein DFH11DRAFT_1741874 [Phellopilus nigrolimitatus]